MAVRPSTEKTVPGDDMLSAPTGCCLPRQVSVAHSWPKRRLDDPLNHAVRRTPEGGKYLQMRPFRGVRRQSSVSLTRPVTPEVAGSSPVAPASKALLKLSFRLDTSTRGAATQYLWNVVGTPAPAAALFRLTRAGRPAHIKPALDLWDEYVGRHVGGHLPARVLDPHIDLPARIARGAFAHEVHGAGGRELGPQSASTSGGYPGLAARGLPGTPSRHQTNVGRQLQRCDRSPLDRSPDWLGGDRPIGASDHTLMTLSQRRMDMRSELRPPRGRSGHRRAKATAPGLALDSGG
jgi:hypothetical protein